MNPILYRYKDTESVIKVMDGYTPGDGWSPLYGSDEVKAATDAALAAPAWHDAPTCAGLWVNMMSGRLIVITEETLEAWQNAAVRWYGPISPDGGQS